MRNTHSDTDVMIVGAGPVGLFLANECARRGLRFRIVEQRAGQSAHSKALAIFPRTLEIFDMAGIAEPFLQAAHRVSALRIVSGGQTQAHMPFAPAGSPYPFIAMVPQDVTESLLATALRDKGVAVAYRTSFVSATQDRERVRVTLERDGARQTWSTRFVVGCDGAHSAVRAGLNLPFEGGDYDEHFMLADIETNDALVASELYLCPNSAGPLALFPMSATRWRIVAVVAQRQGDAPSLALTRRLLAERAPAGITAHALHWSSYFRIHHRRASRLRVECAFIAGDAAHVHSPFGGQGMNTGLHDVWNLAWKLDLTLRGHGGDALLDSYGAERLPVIKGVIRSTDFMTRAMGTRNRLAAALRDAAIPMLSRLLPFQRAFVQRMSELGIAYHGSPIVEGAGERYLDAAMRGGGILSRYLLMLGDDADANRVAAACDCVATMPGLLELRRAPGPGLKLVRPDGYVAFAARHAGAGALESARLLLLRQTARPCFEP